MLKVKTRKSKANIRLILSYYGNPKYAKVDVRKHFKSRTLREYQKYLVKEGLLIKDGRSFKTDDTKIFWPELTTKKGRKLVQIQDMYSQQFNIAYNKFIKKYKPNIRNLDKKVLLERELSASMEIYEKPFSKLNEIEKKNIREVVIEELNNQRPEVINARKMLREEFRGKIQFEG